MARTDLDLANAALSYLVRDNLRNLDGSDLATVKIKGAMEQARDEVIESFDWPECRVVSKLTLTAGVDLRSWTYVYVLPSDVVKLWRVGPQDGAKSYPYERGMSSDISLDTQYIFSSFGDAYARYGSSRVNIGRFSSLQFDCIAMRLAILTCMPITKDAKLLAGLERIYPAKLSKAQVSTANSEPEVVSVDFVPETIAVRSQ